MYLKSKFVFILLLIHVITLLRDSEGATVDQDNVSNKSLKCLALKDCFFYNQYVGENILTSLKTIIQKDIIRNACGFSADGEVEKVICPNISLDGEEEEIVTNVATGTVNLKDISECDASLSIRHAHESNILEYEDLSLGGKRSAYPNLKKGYSVLKQNVILHVESYGCACWEMFDLPRFRGDSEMIVPGDRQYISVRPGSLQRMICPENFK